MTVERIDYQCGNVTGKGALVWNEKISGKRPLMLVMTELARRYRKRHQAGAEDGRRQIRRLRRLHVRRGQDLRRPADLGRNG